MNKIDENMMLELRKEYIKSYMPDMEHIMPNGSPDSFFESRTVNNFDDVILYLSECIDGKHDKDKNELLEYLKDFPIGYVFDKHTLYESQKIYSMILLIKNFKGTFDGKFINMLEENDIYYDDISKNIYNNIMKFIDMKYKVVLSENGYILFMDYNYLFTNRHVFTLYIDKRIADTMSKFENVKFGKEGDLSRIFDYLYYIGGRANIIWKY